MSEHQITIKAVVEPELKPLDKAEVTKYQDELQKINNETPVAELADDSYFQYVPAAAKNFVDTMRKELISQSSSIEQVMSKAVNGEALSSEIVNGMKQGIGYFSAGMKTLFSASGSFASVIGSIPQSMIAEFDKDFAEMARSASSIINNNAIRLKSNPVSDDTYTRILQKDRAFNAGATAVANKYSIPTDQMSKLIKGIVQVTVPTSMRSDYFADAAGSSFGSIRHLKVNPEYATYKERLPEMYRDIPDAPTLRTRSEIRKDASLKGFLSQEQYKVVQDLAATNPAWEEALRLAGHATRKSYNGSSGKLYMPNAMTKAEYAEALGILHQNVLLPALEGAPAFQKSITDTNWWTQKSMANKTSRTPTEAIAAFNALQQIPIMPEYIDVSTQAPQYRHRLGSSIGLNSGINIRPDTYQIMSLTLDDFKAGKLLDPKEGAKNIYGDKAVGASTNRMVLRSTYSDLLGMFGHNTYGTGSKTRPDVPPVLQLDLTDRIFKQENGDLVFDKETGIPLPNEETMKLIEQIFTPRKSISYGNGQEYRYPSYNWGNKGYVPTTIHKNGIIDFVEEELYRSKSAEFLNKYGVNIFDNLVSLDDEFTTVKGLSKPIDARNRMHTPSVPFSELGGRMPEKRKTGFVDLESVTGLNGASVFMPGYLPADALTLRSVGFKGAGFTTDFHKLIKDLYGEDVSEFYAPTWNAPEDIKKVFKDQGIGEVRKIYDTPSLAKKYGVSNFNEDFIDVMKYDALIDASMNKTPFYKNRSHTEVQDMFFDVLDSIGGMRGVQTDKGFKSWSDTISKQVSQNLDITDEEWAENDRLWDEYINDLRYNPEKVIDMLFSDENNPLAQRVQKEHGLLWTDQEARTRVRDAITEAEESKRNRKLFSRKDAVNLLALPNPGEIFGKLGTMNKKDVLDQNLMDIMALGYNEDVDRVAVAPWGDTASIAGWRYPNNVGEQFTMDNIAEYIALLNRYNMSKNAAWVNMKTIDKMGGGDVDGDTIQAVRNRFVDMVKRTYANRGVKVDENRSAYKQDQDVELEGGARKVQPSDFADMLYRKAASVFRMASDSNAGNALAQGDWSDPEFVEFASRAGADLKAMYDIDTTFAKTGVLSKWSNYARTAKTMGVPFISAFKGLQGAVKEGDYSGIKDFSKVNFPSIYQGSIANYLMSIAQTPYSSETLDEFIRQQESIQGISNIDESNPIEVARRNYLRFNNSLMSKFATGRAQIMSSEDQAELESLRNTWGKLVSDRLDKPGIDDTERNYLRDQLQQVNEQETRLQHNREFGITQDKITRGEGYAPVLRQGRLTSDISTFETAANAEADKVAAEVALSIGENSELLKAQREAVEAERRRGLLREAEAHKYSWSEIHALEKNPTEWFSNYYNPDTKGKREKNWSAVIGDAAHLAWQTYAEKRIANDNDYGTPEEFEKIFNDYILGFTDQVTGRKLFPALPVAGNKMFTPEQQKRYTQTLNYVRNLPNAFHDEEFLSAEENVTPDVGSQLTHPEVRLASSGRLDTKTRNKKTGEVTVWDLKPHKLYEQNRLTGTSGLDQPVLYAGSMPEGAVQKVGLIGYADPIDNNTRVEELTPEWIANVQQRVAAITQRMQQFALAGGTFDILKNGGINGSNFFSDVMLGRFDTSGGIVQPVKSVLNPSTPMPTGYYQFAANSYFGNNPPSGPNNPPSNNPPPNNPPPSGPNNPPQSNANGSMPVYQSDKEDLARAFSTRTLIDKELEKMESIRSKLFQKEMYPEGRENNYGIWDMYDFQTSELAYEQTRRRLQLHGASNDEISELAIARQNARQQYEATLRESASNDILHFTESIVDAQLKRNTSQGARGLVDAAKSLDEQYENAVAAYNKLSSVENPTPEDTKALQNAEKLKTALDETKDTYMGQLMSDAQEQMEYSMEQLLVSSKGKGLSKTDRVNKSVAQFEKQREKLLNDLDYLNLNDLIDENEYNDLKEKIGTIKTEDYKKRATAQAEAEDRLSNLQRDISYDRLIQQGDQLKRHATPFARDDFLTRALDRRDSKVSSWKQYKLQTENELEREKINFSTMDPSSEGYQEAANKIKNLEEASAQASSAIETLQNPLSVGAEVAAQFGDAVGKLATRLGRQLFQKALQETKRFVQEYDASMTEIQMITLKSDDEISSLGDNLIQSALDMRVNVSDVTSAASNLYRQGLSDEEVDTRMEDVIKFSKVAKIKAEEASKIITTAMQNELVDNSGEAMDALVALGDTAATTASDIAKGMQKSAAAANEAGVSYQELVTLLTIGTSKTQLGGSSVGTALNTLFYRLYKVGEGEDVIDENGNHISSTAVSRALERAGVSVYGEGGKFRGAYDILTELGSKWNTLDDTDQSLILSQLGAGRQRNNVATILQGLAEDNGELAGRYLSTAGGSEGITDKKYEAYMDSLVAKMSEVRTSWDQLVATFNAGDLGSGVLGTVSQLIQGFTHIQEASNGAVGGVTAITVALTALAAVIKTHPVIAALVIGATVLTTGVSMIGNAIHNADPEVQYQQRLEAGNKRYQNYTKSQNEKVNSIQKTIDDTNKLAASYDNLSTAEQQAADVQIEAAISSLTGAFPDLTAQLDTNASAIKKWRDIANGAQGAADNFSQEVAQQAETLNQINYADIDKRTKESVDELETKYAAVNEERQSTSIEVNEGMRRALQFNNLSTFLREGLSLAGAENPEQMIGSLLGVEDVAQVGDDRLIGLINSLSNYNMNATNNGYTRDWFGEGNSFLDFISEVYGNKTLEKDWSFDKSSSLVTEYQSWLLGRLGQRGKITSTQFAEQMSNAALNMDTIPDTEGNILWQALFGSLTNGEGSVVTENGPQYVMDSDDAQALKTPLRDLLSWMAQNGQISAEIESAYAGEDDWVAALLSDFDTGFQQRNDGGQMAGLIAGTLARTLGGENGVLDAYRNDYQEKYDKIFTDAIQEYINQNTSVSTSDIDAFGLSAITGAIASRHEGQAYSEYVNRDVLPQEITQYMNEYLANPLAFSQRYGDANLAPFQYRGQGFRSQEEIIAQIRKQYGEMASRPGFSGISYDEYLRQELGDFQATNNSDFFSSILAGADAYKTADKNAPGYSADRIYEQLQGVTSFEDLINKIQSGDITGMDAFLKQDATDIANWLANYITEENGQYSLTEGAASDEAWKIFRSKIAGKSANYADAEKATRIEIADAALATLNEYFNADKETTLGTNVTDYEALKGIIGDRYAGILAAGPNSEELLSEEDIAYMQMLIDNYRLGIESTPQQRNLALSQAQQAIQNGSLTSLLASGRGDWITSAMSGMEDSSTYLAAVQALEAKRAEIGRDLTTEERAGVLEAYGGEEAFQIMEDNFERFKQNAEVEIHIKNLQSLEEAGKLAAGTAENFQKLRQGGTVALEVITKLTTEGYQSGQQAAMLYNGTPTEQAQAAMAYLDMGADQFYANNGAHVRDYIAQARSYQQQNQTKDASAWWEEYNAAQTEPEKQRILAAAKSAGYVPTQDRLADINGFKFDQNVLDVNKVSSFAGQEATQKALDTTANLLALINETFEGTATEQRNAEGIANEATRRYLTNRANVAAGTYTWQEDEEEAQRREALRETTIQNLQAQESEGLIKQGTAQLYEQLTSPIAETVEQAKQGLVNQITTFQRESSVFEAMQGLTHEQWALNGAAYAEELGGLLGWSDQEKQFYSKQENFSAVEEIMAKRGEDFSKGLETLLEQMFDLDLSDFEGLENITDTLSAFSEEDGNEAAAVLLSVFETLSQIAGLEWDGSKFTTGDSTTVSDVTNQYTTEYQRQQADREILSSLNDYVREGMTLDQFGTGLIGTEEGQPFRTVADYKNFIDRTGIGSILGQVGNEGFTAADINRLRQATPQGSLYRDTNYRTQYNKFNELRNADGTFDMTGLKSAMNDPDFSNWINQFTHLQTALDEVRETSSTTGTEFGHLTDEMEHGLLEAEDAFGSKTKDVVGAMDDVTGSAQKQNNALKQLRSSMTAVSNNEYYRKQFTEKNVRTGKTSEYLQGLGFTKDQITGGKFDDQIKAAIELDRSADFEALSEDLQANFGTVTQKFKDYVADNPIQIDGLQVGVDSGSVTVSTEELISNFGSALSDTQNKLLQLVLASGLEVNWQVDWNDDQTLITPVVNSVAGSKPSGGGGGGKSAAQKAIDDAKNDVTLAEHYSNMAEKMYTHYETFGDSRGMMSTLEDRRIALEGESGVIKNNIADLEAELAKTSEGTDDWQALKEAINSAYESLVDVQNEMEDISNQKVQVIVEKYEIQGKETDHQYNMVGTEMEMALLDGDYDKYSELAAQKEELINTQIENNASELQELYAARAEQEAQYGKATQDTIDQIYALEEEKLNKELELRQFQNEVADQEIANEEKKNSAESAQAESEASTAGAYASYYKRAGNHDAYRNQILAQNAAYAKQIQIQKALLAIIQAKAEAELLQNGYTEQYYEYLVRIYEIQSTIAGLEANIANNLLDIEQDYVDEMLENYKREVEVFDHYENLLNSRKKMYENAGADEAYDIMREKERGLIESELEGNRSYLEQMKSLLANTTYNSDAWWTLRDKIWDVKEAIAEAETELENWNRENEKIKIDRWFEDWGREQDERDHNLKIAQYEQTRTKNAGEYTNYGILLEYENDMRQKNIDILKDQIAILQEELKNENIGEEDYYRVAKAIREKSQAIYNDTKEIEKNTKALAENRETIRKTQMTLQNMVLEVIKDNKQREEDMLSARIRMEGYILEAIKARYTEEWKFISETYEKQRDALNKEKQLINERLNYRKQAAEQEDQYEQLRTFEQQYALISADPTRSKEANELSRQIADLREDISWTRASEEAAYATERIDQELQAIEDFLTIGQERLNEMLENANNFATEVNEIMGRSMTEIVAWLQENNEMYKNSLADSQIQMVETWEQTWKDMMGITDTYWDEIAQITSDKTTFINYMIENSIDYLNASLEGQTSYVYQWETAYDNAVAAVTDNLNSVSNAYDQLYEHTAAYYSALWDMYAETARAYEAMYNDIDNLGKQSASLGGNDDSTQQQQQATNADGSVKNGWEKVGDKWYYWENGVEAKGWRNINDEYGDVWYAFDQTTGEMLTGKQYLGADFTDQNGQSWEGTYYFNKADDAFMEGAMVAEDKEVQSGRSWIQNADGTWNYYDDTGAMVTDQWVHDDYYGDNYVDEEGVWDPNKKKKYATGGLVDYTGLAQVDGTPTRPESFLDDTDTELLRTLIDAFDYVTVPSMHASLDEISGSATGVPSVGEINITLNEAKLESDADYEEVAQKVGRAFTKELTSKGFNLANYSF